MTPRKARKKTPRRQALFTTDVVNICCPFCGSPQPNGGDRSEQWTPTDVQRELTGLRNGILVCVSCDETFRVILQNRATFET